MSELGMNNAGHKVWKVAFSIPRFYHVQLSNISAGRDRTGADTCRTETSYQWIRNIVSKY